MSPRTKHRVPRPAEPARRDPELLKFAYAAAHDLSSPLRKIITFSGLLKARLELKADLMELDYLERIRRSAAAASAIVTDLMTLARLAHEELPPENVNLDAVLNEVKQELAAEIAAAGAVIESPRLPVIVAHRALMHRLLATLLSNAVKFGVAGRPPAVRVEYHRTAEGLELRVADDGIGFDASYAEKIFEPFARLNAQGVYPGHGLGLTIARAVARRYGGDLTAASAPGGGSTFTARLPASLLAR